MTSEIRANTLKNRVGLGTVSFTNTGPVVSGIVTANSFSGPLTSTSIDLNGDLDVDGHTNLDNVSVAGVTTMSGNLTISNTDPRIIFVDTNNNPDFTLHANGGDMQVENSGSGTQVKLESSGSTRLFGNVIANKDLDVDGHTNLDNVSIAGVTTMGQTTIFTTGGTTLLLKDSDSSNPADRSGIAFVDQNNTQTAFIGKESASDAVLTINNTNTINPIRLKVNNTTRLEVGNAGVYATGSLSATGTLSSGGTLYIPDDIQHTGDADTKIRFPSADNISFETGGSERFRVANSLVTVSNSTLLASKITNSSSHTSHNANFYGGDVNTGGVRIEVAHSTTTVSGNTASGAFPHNLLLSNYSGSGSADNRMVSIGFDIPTTSSHANATIAYQATGSNGVGDLQFWLENGNTSYERLRITSDGNVLCGGTAVSQTNRQLVVGSNSEANLAIETHNTSASETANIRFYRSRGTAASPTTLVDNDVISNLLFYGHDGTDYAHAAAMIRVECDGTVAGNQMPGAMSFHTNVGSTSATERLRITSDGKMGLNHTTPPAQFVVRAPGGSGHCSSQVHSGDSSTIMNMMVVQGGEGRFGMNTNHNLAIYTNGLEKLHLSKTGSLFLKSLDAVPINQAESGHYSSTGYNAGHALGLMVKRSICVSDADTKGVGGIFLSHTRNVTCDGSTYNMITLHNREGTFVGDVYVGFAAGGAGVVRHYKFTCLYAANTLTSIDNASRAGKSESISVNISTSNDAHFFQVIPNMSTNEVHRVSMTIVGAACGRNDGAGGDYYTVNYN